MKKIILILTLILIIPFTKVNAEEVTLTLFHGDGCPHCADEEKYLDILQKQLGKNLNIQTYEVWNNDDNLELLNQVRTAFGDNNEGVPFTIIGNKYFSGFNDEIGKQMKQTIIDSLKQENINAVELIKNGKSVPTNINQSQDPTIHFSLLGETNVKETSPITIAFTEGIGDAINLGSLWIILFLAGIMLAVYNNKKRLILGGIFVFTSTITYMIFAITNAEFTINQTTFIRTFIAIVAIIIAAISIDAHLKINIPKKSILQVLQELFGKKQFLMYSLGIIITSVITSFVLVNQSQSSSVLLETAFEMQNVTTSAPYMFLYFLMYLITSIILVGVVNVIIKELIIENTIGTYNRLIAGIIMLVAAIILIYLPGTFMMV